MPSPFCTICKGIGDSEGRMSSEAFPRGISEAVYPHGCIGFTRRRGFEEMALRWEKLDKKEGIGESILEMDFDSPGSVGTR